ncbi:MAG: tRNA pseudouridine synthase [Marmoricola sp.]|nr:tRNA pseudouridine synthase [Marmoricola sp.]
MRLRLDLAYDGTSFHGWAAQTGLRTVQGELEQALRMVLRTDQARLTVAGRTDTGVHARAQVAHLDLDPALLEAARGRSREDASATLTRRLNGLLDPDVRIHRVGPAPEGFDARFSAVWRRYAYRVADGAELVDPLTRAQVLVHERRLDLGAMNAAAAVLLGQQDFASFCRKRAGATTIRTLQDLRWERDPAGLAVATVRADAFCHHMVRSLVGCLIAVGEHRQPASWVQEILSGRRRDPSVKVARAHGLTLEEVAYPDEAQLAARAQESRAVRTLEEG